MTSELVGRDLDWAVAQTMGWLRWTYDHPDPKSHYRLFAFVRPPNWNVADEYAELAVARVKPAPPEMPLFVDAFRDLPAYSAPDCSGLAPVLAWLTGQKDVTIVFESDRDCWRVTLCPRGAKAVALSSPTLPEAACRLLIAWAAKRKDMT